MTRRENPYEPPREPSRGDVVAIAGPPVRGRALVAISVPVIVLGFMIGSLFSVAFIAEFFFVGHAPPGIVDLVFAVLFVGIPFLIATLQFTSVFRQSVRAAKAVRAISWIGASIAAVAAIVYPIFEYFANFSPRYAEVFGLIGYSILAGLFFANAKLHHPWIAKVEADRVRAKREDAASA